MLTYSRKNNSERKNYTLLIDFDVNTSDLHSGTIRTTNWNKNGNWKCHL